MLEKCNSNSNSLDILCESEKQEFLTSDSKSVMGLNGVNVQVII